MITQNQIYKFCTIFDSSYFTKGLALYYSLEKVCDFQLYIFTPDEKCFNLLMNKKLSKANIVHLNEIADQELKKIKRDRDVGEYFWTIKASCINFLFKKYKLDFVTYVDADIFFYTSPLPFFKEMGNNSVLITPHNFSPEYKSELKNGVYNAGFLSYTKMLQEICKADFLLVCATEPRHVPGKLFKYLRTGNPIIAFFDGNEEVGEILHSANAGMIFGYEESHEKFFESYHSLKTNTEVIEQFERKRISEGMSRILDSNY